MTAPRSWTVDIGEGRLKRDRLLRWTGAASGEAEAHARARRALTLCAAMLRMEPPDAPARTISEAHYSGDAFWTVGPRLRAAPRARRDPVPITTDSPHHWLQALVHDAFGYGAALPSYGADMLRTEIRPGESFRCSFSHWTLIAPLKTSVLAGTDGIERAMALWTAMAFDSEREGEPQEDEARMEPEGDLYSATLRAARARKMRSHYADDLEAALGWLADLDRKTP